MTIALLVVDTLDILFVSAVATGVRVAAQCADDVHVMLFGDAALANEVATIEKVSQVYYADNPVFSKGLAEPCAAEIAELGNMYDVIVMASSAMGKNILPRVSGLLKRVMLSDVVAISEGNFTRPIYAGNALETVRVDGAFLLSYRPSCFEPLAGTQPACAITPLKNDRKNTWSEWVSMTSHPQDRPELSKAKYVVAGGRGLKSKEQFKLIEQLADCLGAAVGASRAAVDAGFVPNECQVGQTGKIVAPILYIAIGISGAIQHVAGMKSSKVIVAINQDPDAPIFQIADYGWVADLFVAIPALEKALKEKT